MLEQSRNSKIEEVINAYVEWSGVNDEAWTRNIQIGSLELYQLSYVHRLLYFGIWSLSGLVLIV